MSRSANLNADINYLLHLREQHLHRISLIEKEVVSIAAEIHIEGNSPQAIEAMELATLNIEKIRLKSKG